MVDHIQSVRLTAALPPEVTRVFNDFFTAEVTTIGKNGYPVTWPVLPVFEPKSFTFVIFSSIGLAQKAVNIRRDGRISMLYSEPAGSGFAQPPAVLVQGHASAPDQMLPSLESLGPDVLAALKAQGRRLLSLQPGMRMYIANPVSRWLMDWYFMRLVISISPQRVTWWPRADFSLKPEVVEVQNVA